VIGSEWAANINKASFVITFPQALQLLAEDRFAYYGYLGSTDSLPNATWKNSSTLVGSTDRILNPYEAMTVGVKLPSAFIVLDPVKEQERAQATMFWVDKVLGDPLFYLTFLLPILLFMRYRNMWKKYGDDAPLSVVVDYDIPDMDSALA